MEAIVQIKNIFNEYKALYPKSSETFILSIENAKRWTYLINKAKEREQIKYKLYQFPEVNIEILKFVESRRVFSFEQFPAETQSKYLQIAGIFSSRKIYAAGSRVNGDYITINPSKEEKHMRRVLMKKNCQESDYDFVLNFQPGDNLRKIKELIPKGFDLMLNYPDNEHKILVPMWDFSKIPAQMHNEILNLIKQKQWVKLMNIHNEYKLSDEHFCCDHKPAMKWFTWAAENNIFNGNQNTRLD